MKKIIEIITTILKTIVKKKEVKQPEPLDKNSLGYFFSYKEMTRSQTATRYNIKNIPNKKQTENLKALCLSILDKIRLHFGPVTITSGFRCATLNQKIGGSSRSQHKKGEAADFVIAGQSNREAWEWIVKESGLDFDQVIAEFVGKNGTEGWIHISFKKDGENRNKVSIAKKIKGRTRYFHYTKEQVSEGNYRF